MLKGEPLARPVSLTRLVRSAIFYASELALPDVAAVTKACLLDTPSSRRGSSSGVGVDDAAVPATRQRTTHGGAVAPSDSSLVTV